MKRNNKKGFTIVELVIVIAVIAILSAVLIPTFGNVVENAKETARDADAKSIYDQYLATWDYVNNDGVPAQDCYVKSDDSYYKVTDGNIDLDSEKASIDSWYEETPTGSNIWVVHSTHTYNQEGDKCICGAANPNVTP